MQAVKPKKKPLFVLLTIVVVLLGTLIRIYDLSDAPLDFHPTRQLHSALMSRGMYYQLTGETSAQAQRAIEQWKLEGLIEPPIMEWLTAFGYRLVGEVDLRIPRLIAMTFWLLSAILLVIGAKEEQGWKAALIGVAFFLFYPYGVIASRSFQPETLLVFFLAFFLLALLQWDKRRNWRWAVAAGLLGGVAIFVKTVAAFFVAGMWLGWLLSDKNWKTVFKDAKIWVAFLLTILPYGIYLVYGVWIDKGLAGQFSLRFFPSMWTDVAFYLRWLSNLRRVVSVEWLVAALVGIFLMEKKSTRNILLGAGVGYILLGFALPHHISTHDYYHLPLLLLVAFAVTALFQKLIRWLGEKKTGVQVATGIAFCMLFGIYAMDARSTLNKQDYRQEVAYWERVGTMFSPQDKVVALSQDYSYRLAYWGWVSSRNWPNMDDIALRQQAGLDVDIADYFEDYTSGYDYFLVTDFEEFTRQPELEEWLRANYPLLSTEEGVLVFDLTPANP
ncbi:MAG TPA: hypothetical protein DCK95_08170 [Anaerolineaceae bacterium]|uniref:Putative membrane protein n=1 Tax=Anaerolinea thermophila TaxID=167964 RepID=A0A101FX55_9CHLR|nr:MAG: putative membrane protein [Anaerolinea thermophila]HAF62286.1 hypothetical protein [Anaerolineaceae bacterium]